MMKATAEASTQLVRRTARLKPPSVPEGSITVSAPPRVDSAQAGGAGWLQYLFPVVGSLGGMLFIVNNPKPLFVASGLFFMLSSIGMGVGMGVQQRLTARRRSYTARAKYLEYLSNLRSELQATAAAQRAASAWRHPAPDALLALIRSSVRLWERRPADADFVLVRVGQGREPLATPLQVPAQDGLAQAPDPVCASAADELVQAHSWVAGDAITVDLQRARVVSIIGPRAVGLDLARAVCCQLAVLHAPEEVRVLLCARPGAAPDWEWIKWLPHLRGVENGTRGDPGVELANDPAELDSVLSSRAARARKVQAGVDLLDSGPYLVVFTDGVVPSPEGVTLLRRVPSRTTIVVLAGGPEGEPSEVDVRIEVAPGRLKVESLRAGDPPAEGRADRLGPRSAEAVARRLAPLRLSEEPGARLADTISLTSLLGVGDVGALDPAAAWRRRPLAESLRAPIGVSSDGEAVVLDLKESALGGDGPHGLVIGATGSGKSELLRTLVTGLALTHPPDLLSFVLADFKGGAAFSGLQELPHVAGLITNLANDLAMVDRMHAALFGEIRRRQELLRSAGNLASLREYQHRLAEGQALAPLPYLLILVDEFGELLASRPDFIDLFVAVGRLGRSLGMHLLLSSQQLDEGRLRGLEGHLSYRIAMRTFSAAESRIVLGVPDAYELPPIPGSAYLKVGTTVYKRFRAALVSQVYSPPSESTVGAPRPREFRLTNEGPASRPAVQDPNLHSSGPTLLDVAVPHLRDAAARAHQIWLPPLEPRVGLDAIMSSPPRPSARGTLSVPIGLVDKPAEQKRDVLDADLSGAAGHLLVVGASLTGKTTLLRTLVASFALTHTPLEAQFYCIDYGGGGLSALAGLPHVGGIAGRQDPELVVRTVTSVSALVDEREAQFKAAGIDSLEALRSRRGKGDLDGDGWADVFLVIDNWPALRQDFEELEAPLQEIAARGLGYGVHLVMTANRWIDVRSALRESVGGRLELRLNDPTESAVNRKAAENVAKGVPGRGINVDSLHFQVALPRIDGSVDIVDQQRGLEELVGGVVSGWSGAKAKPVLVLPRLVTLEEVAEGAAQPGGVPIGVSERDLGVVRLDLVAGDPHFLVFGDGEAGKTNVLRTYLLGLVARHSADEVQVLMVDYRRALLGVVPADYLLSYAGAEAAAKAQIAETAQVLTRRLPPADVSIESLRARSWWHGPDVYVVVDHYDLVATPSSNPLLP